jgi:Flp pilus assembly protein TadD
MDSEENARRGMKVKWLRVYRWILTEVEREIEVHPGYADLQNQFGLLLAMRGEWTRAEQHFFKSLRLNPKYREAALHLGFLYVEAERWREAEEIFLSDVKRHPRDAFLHHLLGMLYLRTGRLKEATAQIHKAIQVQSTYRDDYRKGGV